jgi:hypothetical protein
VIVTHNDALARRAQRVVRPARRPHRDRRGRAVTPPRVLLRLSLRNLMVHKLRSTLSVLGVLFGVAAVVAMSSVGLGGAARGRGADRRARNRQHHGARAARARRPAGRVAVAARRGARGGGGAAPRRARRRCARP